MMRTDHWALRVDRSNIDECALMLITFISFFSLDHVYTQEISLCTVHESRRTVQRTDPGTLRAPPRPRQHTSGFNTDANRFDLPLITFSTAFETRHE